MKKIIFIMGLFVLVSCRKEDQTTITNTIDGEWHLIQMTCFCEGVEYEEYDQLWEFDLVNNNISVTNTLLNPEYPALQSGTYPAIYTSDSIFFENSGYRFHIDGNSLFLEDSPELDGPILKFVE